MNGNKNKGKRYTAAQRGDALRRVEKGESKSKVAREIGASGNTISYWQKQAQSKTPGRKTKRASGKRAVKRVTRRLKLSHGEFENLNAAISSVSSLSGPELQYFAKWWALNNK